MKETKKLAVIFPGIGYTADKPLLYYARRIAAEQGYEIMTIPYSGFPKKIRGDRKRMEESFRIALDQSEHYSSAKASVRSQRRRSLQTARQKRRYD